MRYNIIIEYIIIITPTYYWVDTHIWGGISICIYGIAIWHCYIALLIVIYMGNIDMVYVSSYVVYSTYITLSYSVIYIDGFIYSGVFSRVEKYEYEE